MLNRYQTKRAPKIRFHDLSHTAASLMLNYGIPVLIVSRRLGHSKPSITLNVYGHLIPSKQEEAAQLMDDLLAPINVTNRIKESVRQGSPDNSENWTHGIIEMCDS